VRHQLLAAARQRVGLNPRADYTLADIARRS
jgi:hypothetical protein